MNMELRDKKRKFIDSIKDALRGIKHTYKTEKNFKREVIIGLIVIICGVLFKLNITEWLIIILLIGWVLTCELINTTIEKTIDLYTAKYNEIAKIVKDASGGAVLVSSITSSTIGLLIFVPKIISLIKELLWKKN